MKVAVVVVCYNSGEMIEKCLTHIRNQTWSPDRVIVADNNSTDDATIALLDRLQDVETIRISHNLGYGGAINHVASLLDDFDFLATLNPDAFPDDTWLSSLMASAARFPEYGSFASLQLKADDREVIDGAGDVLHISGVPWRRHHNRQLSNVHLADEPVFSACGGAALYRLGAFRDVGGFDESLFMYVEDIDLGFRLQAAGYPCRFVPAAVTEHIGSATTGQDSEFTLYHGHRNLSLVYLKNMPALLLILTIPLHLLACLFTILVYMLRGKTRPIFRAKIDALASVRSTWRQRSDVKNVMGSMYTFNLLQKSPFR